jgi:anhydro-N-acetylmuramic acid kinase
MKSYKVIGLMSGSSLDGLDIAACEFMVENNKWNFRIDYADTIEYDEYLRKKLLMAPEVPEKELKKMDWDYGEWVGERVKEFCERHNYFPEFISSHGHTVMHSPELGKTVQIGNGEAIRNVSHLMVINDFRSEDVSKGGQGAPLVPVGDHHLFGAYDCCLNLGGIANLSLEENSKRIAYDICPANLVLNHISGSLGLAYDRNGVLASKGHLIQEIYNQLNELEYYSMPSPKSLGREWAEENILPLMENKDPKDLLHTYVQHISHQIRVHLDRHSFLKGKLLITGGGAFNDFLVKTIEERLPSEITTVIPNELTISYKEALVFAFLGVLRIREEVNCLSSVTGAESDSCSGVIYGLED